jgi:Spy/CpxP family protein refolding chaperone
MKTNVLIVMIALLSTVFTVNKLNSQVNDFKQKKTPEERAKKFSEKMSKGLTLTSEQQSSIYDIMLSHCRQADQIRANETSKETRKEQIKNLRQSTDSQIKALLTDEQALKYEELKQMIKEKRKQKKGKL